ncbi:MAG TPA: hypothetical protein DCP20_06065 [Coriobacteriia bacterium]|nr:MAG: hypothetical protein XD74_0105 [Actinobacteria bacterium 66_15]HAL30264.1 hypothetical protein [Coriobacteriia bacterium]
MRCTRSLLSAAVTLMLVSALVGCAVPGTSSGGPAGEGSEDEPVEATDSMAPVPHQELALQLEPYDGGYFTVLKPAGWEITTGGAYGGFGYMMWDPQEPARRIFYVGEIVPFYASAEQKQVDRQYMDAGGFPVEWYDMPVVSPLTPLELFRNFDGIVMTQGAQAYMPGLPPLDGFEPISTTPADSALPIGQTDLIHATFLHDGVPCQGQFMATVAEFMPFMNGPGGGTGIAGMVVGVMAPVTEYPELQDDLVAAVGSFEFSESYVQEGIQQGQENFKGIMRAGQTLRETSEMVARRWQANDPSSDINPQQWSDAMLGYERVYDPDTDEVYHVENGFFSEYDLHRESYDMSSLEQLPSNNADLWSRPPLDEGRIH